MGKQRKTGPTKLSCPNPYAASARNKIRLSSSLDSVFCDSSHHLKSQGFVIYHLHSLLHYVDSLCSRRSPRSISPRGCSSSSPIQGCELDSEDRKSPWMSLKMTYDKLFIQKWLSSGNRTCPKTQQVLSHTSLTPNLLISDMISKWSKTVGVEKLNQCESNLAAVYF
ncbi:unnamed protein product [Eruca vesicaria subsp. sativa]|uniref:U-box domain-containing protein n=1 Tax=Eruca vesicaria subsp. sativa TaxID=29727 RepID=A0ABC8LK55_ERUVS|nr:unnamed protein product [Eruca vesicaria subsp. sativa]